MNIKINSNPFDTKGREKSNFWNFLVQSIYLTFQQKIAPFSTIFFFRKSILNLMLKYNFKSNFLFDSSFSVHLFVRFFNSKFHLLLLFEFQFDANDDQKSYFFLNQFHFLAVTQRAANCIKCVILC